MIIWSKCLICGTEFKGDALFCGIDPRGPIWNVCALTGGVE
jgi:hypothetical protein